jgi:hypothetical protein
VAKIPVELVEAPLEKAVMTQFKPKPEELDP